MSVKVMSISTIIIMAGSQIVVIIISGGKTNCLVLNNGNIIKITNGVNDSNLSFHLSTNTCYFKFWIYISNVFYM